MNSQCVSEGQLTGEQREISKGIHFDRPQLIRGVAGSGKTVVLACTVARQLVELDRDLPLAAYTPRIAVVCFNRCLVPLIRERTADFYRELSGGKQFDPKRILFKHFHGFLFELTDSPRPHEKGWGGPLQYVHVQAENQQDLVRVAEEYLSQLDALPAPANGLIESVLLDSIYLDEGQDSSPEAIMLLHRLLRPHKGTGERNLIVFYDNAQNVYARTVPNWSQLGINLVGRSTVMKQCIRSSREIVGFGMNVLVGTCAPSGLRVATRVFADINYLKQENLVRETRSKIVVLFAREQGQDPIVREFDNDEDEVEHVCGQLDFLINTQNIPVNELMILTRQKSFANVIGERIKKRCRFIQAIHSPHREELKDQPAICTDSLTVTTPESAKGYSAAIVLLMGSQNFARTPEDRAKFYVACTRARDWLSVTGVKQGASLLDECVEVESLLFPTPDIRGTITHVMEADKQTTTPSEDILVTIRIDAMNGFPSPHQKASVRVTVDTEIVVRFGLESKPWGVDDLIKGRLVQVVFTKQVGEINPFQATAKEIVVIKDLN